MTEVSFHDRMVTMLAKRYMEEYRLGGPKRAEAYVVRSKIGTNPELKTLVNKKVRDLINEATSR